MTPEEIKVKILEIIKKQFEKTDLGIYHVALRNEIGIEYLILNPILRELLDAKIIRTRKGINGTILLIRNDKKKR
jgi:DNA-binding IscR family transcriptional regulator